MMVTNCSDQVRCCNNAPTAGPTTLVPTPTPTGCASVLDCSNVCGGPDSSCRVNLQAAFQTPFFNQNIANNLLTLMRNVSNGRAGIDSMEQQMAVADLTQMLQQSCSSWSSVDIYACVVRCRDLIPICGAEAVPSAACTACGECTKYIACDEQAGLAWLTVQRSSLFPADQSARASALSRFKQVLNTELAADAFTGAVASRILPSFDLLLNVLPAELVSSQRSLVSRFSAQTCLQTDATKALLCSATPACADCSTSGSPSACDGNCTQCVPIIVCQVRSVSLPAGCTSPPCLGCILCVASLHRCATESTAMRFGWCGPVDPCRLRRNVL